MKYLHQFVTTNLNVGGGIDDSQTTGIVLQSLNNIDATKPSVACLTWADPLDTSVAEWITYTSVNSTTNELRGVIRGAEGYSAKSHLNQAVVAFPLSKSHVNDLNTAVSAEHSTAGVHSVSAMISGGSVLDEDTMASNSATALATQQSIKAYVDSGTVTMTNKTLTAPVLGGTVTGTYTLGGTPTIAGTVTFATSGPQSAFSTSSTTTVDVTGVTLTINPTKTVTVNASITGRIYGATAGDVLRCALYIDGVKITEVDYAVVIANYGVSFSLVAQASVASGARVIKMMVHNPIGARSVTVDQGNINVIYG